MNKNKRYNCECTDRFSAYEFVSLFSAVSACRGEYKISSDELNEFITYCKKYGLSEELLSNISEETLAKDLKDAIDVMKKIGLAKESESKTELLISEEIPMSEIINNNINYFNYMVDFVKKFDMFSASINVSNDTREPVNKDVEKTARFMERMLVLKRKNK